MKYKKFIFLYCKVVIIDRKQEHEYLVIFTK